MILEKKAQVGWILLILLVLVIIFIAVYFGFRNGDAPNEINTVNIDNFAFSPQTLVIDAGESVVWSNNDDVTHTVASVNMEFESDILNPGEEFTFTFSEEGEYDYYCTIHPAMTGKIVVQ